MGKSNLIQYLENNPRLETWNELAKRFNIRSRKGNICGKKANDIWRGHLRKKKSPVNLKVKTAWETPSGEMRYSYKVEEDKENDLKALKKHIIRNVKSVKSKKKTKHNHKALMLYTADKHIGAKVSKDSLYPRKYNEKIFRNRLLQLVETINEQVLIYGKFDKLVIMDLGDPLDGFNKKTARHSPHTLPQNLSNKGQFDTFVKAHQVLFDTIVENNFANNIEYYAVSDDNHSSDFGYFANRALEIYLKAKYPFIKVNIAKRFIEHFSYGVHTFMYSHGKDKEDMRTGMPLLLNANVENYIKDYIDYYELKGNLHFIKGDLHQSATQKGRYFRYKNVQSMFGSSKWIQTNFGSGKTLNKYIAGVDYDIVWRDKAVISEQSLMYE